MADHYFWYNYLQFSWSAKYTKAIGLETNVWFSCNHFDVLALK